jgi:phenylalanyl-tRNA synthetase alpha chain
MDLKDIDGLKLRLENELNQINNNIDLENFRLKYLVRKGEIRDLFNALKTLEVEEKRIFGPRLNELKKDIEGLFSQKKDKFGQKGDAIFFDYTQPGSKKEVGSLHPTTLILRHMLKVFKAFGFDIIEANEIESEYYNFDSLNIEKDHPARDM